MLHPAVAETAPTIVETAPAAMVEGATAATTTAQKIAAQAEMVTSRAKAQGHADGKGALVEVAEAEVAEAEDSIRACRPVARLKGTAAAEMPTVELAA